MQFPSFAVATIRLLLQSIQVNNNDSFALIDLHVLEISNHFGDRRGAVRPKYSCGLPVMEFEEAAEALASLNVP